MRTRVALIAIAVIMSLLAGCTQEQEPEVQLPKALYLPSLRAAATANIHLGGLDADGEITNLITGTLYTWMPLPDRSGTALVPELAGGEPIDVSGDGTVWHVKIREDAKWENGEPITADSFIYSWKMMLDPKLVNSQASNFARYFIEIENALAYAVQESTEPKVEVAWEDVGIKKIDDHTIELTLAGAYSVEEVMRHFAADRSGLVYEPIYEAEMNADRTATLYGTSKETVLSSGPFILVEWVKGAERVFEKNPYYVHADRIKLDKIVYRVVEDPGTRVQMFENGELDYVDLVGEYITQYADDPRVIYGASRAIRQLEINSSYPDQPIFDNINFRKAIYYAIDRETIAELANAQPMPGIVPYTSAAYSDGTLFRTVAEQAGYLPENYGYDPEPALEYFNKALEEEGLDKVSVVLNYTTTLQDHIIIAEFIQQSLPEIFGEDRFEMEIRGLPSAQNIDNLKASPTNPRAYQMALAQWGLSAADFAPNKVFEVYTSDYPRRNGPYKSTRLDELYAESIRDEVRRDEKRVVELALEMEKVFIEEVINVPIITSSTGLGIAGDRLILAVDQWSPGGGWCWKFADIDVTK